MRPLLLLLALSGCATLKPDGTHCKASEHVTRPDLCGTTAMRAEWARAGGVNSPAVRYCNAVADYMTTTVWHWTGLLWCDGASPVNHCRCVPWADQIASLPQ